MGNASELGDSTYELSSKPANVEQTLAVRGAGEARAMRYEEMAWEFAEVFAELDTEQTNEMLAKNVPMETLEFFSQYSEKYGRAEDVSEEVTRRLPNLMLVGYLLRVLEERLSPGKPS